MPAVHFRFGRRLAAAFAALGLLLCPALAFAQTEVPVEPEAGRYEEPKLGGPKIYVLSLFDLTDQEQSRVFYEDAQRIAWAFSEITCPAAVLWDDEFYKKDEWSVLQDDSEPQTKSLSWAELAVSRMRTDNDAYQPDYSIFTEAVEFLKKKKVGEKDALFIYWSGHGFFQNGKHYLQQANGKSIPRQELLDAAKECGARLTVFITDSCASIKFSGRAGARELPPAEPVAPAAPAAMIPPLYEELFFNHRGVLDVNSSSEGERAYSYDIKGIESIDANGNRHIDYDPSGGCFTLALTGGTVELYPFHRQMLNLVRQNDPSLYAVADDMAYALSFGAFIVLSGERKSWSETLGYAQKATNIIFHNLPNYRNLRQRDQHIAIFELPTRITATPKPLFSATFPPVFLGGDVDDYDRLPWTPQAIYYPEKGDQILEINGTPVNGSEPLQFDYDGPYQVGDIASAKKNRVYALIKRSADTAVLKLKDHKTGKNYYFRTKLNPKGSGTRFGLYPEIDAEGNLVAGATVPGSPATRGQFAWE